MKKLAILVILLFPTIAFAWGPIGGPPIPDQAGHAGKVLGTDGTTLSWGAGGSGAPTTATYITQTPDATLSAEQAMSALATGIVKNTTTTGVQSVITDSAGVAGAISDETGSGPLVFGTSPTLVTPALGTPSALVGTNISGTAASLTAGAVSTITGLAPDTATTQATQPNITTAANLVTVGALNSGSITSGFGNIDNGASTIDGGAITADGLLTGNANLEVKNGATSQGHLYLYEDSDDGTNKTDVSTGGALAADVNVSLGETTDNYVLTYDDATNTWAGEVASGGGVSVSGTPVDNQVMVWVDASTAEGDANFIWDATNLTINNAGGGANAVFQKGGSERLTISSFTNEGRIASTKDIGLYPTNEVYVQDGKNLAIGSQVVGTSATNTFAAKVGTAPSAIVTDLAQMFVNDYGAGDARWYFMGEASTNTVSIGDGKVEASGTIQGTTLTSTGDSTIVATTQSPAATDACTTGEIAWDASYVYICTASTVWKRAALTGGY